jgi:dihydrofolate reductase
MRTSAFVGVTLDGFLARPDGAIDYLKPYEGEEHGFTDFFATVDTLLMGRMTYDWVASWLAQGNAWPYDGKRVFVTTHRPLDGGHGERAVAGEPAALLAQLEPEGAQHVYVDGGVVIRDFLDAGLLDTLTMTIVPCLIGAGRALFGGVRMESGLVLDEVKQHAKGMVQLRYRCPRAILAP